MIAGQFTIHPGNPHRAEWLKVTKKAYFHKGQAAEWQAYIANLRATYARRPALQKAIADL